MVDMSLKVSFDLHIILVSLFLLAVFCFLIKATVVFVLSFPRLGLQTGGAEHVPLLLDFL